MQHMTITIVDDNGQKYEKVLLNGRKGVAPDEAILATLNLFSLISTKGVSLGI